MIECPKCGGNWIRGPVYVPRDGYQLESLRYTCMGCGYGRCEKTLEQQRKEREEVKR